MIHQHSLKLLGSCRITKRLALMKYLESSKVAFDCGNEFYDSQHEFRKQIHIFY